MQALAAETNVEKLLRQLPRLRGREDYVTHLRTKESRPEVVAIIYDHTYEVTKVHLERWVDGEHQYLIEWQPTKIHNDHIEVLTRAPLCYAVKRRTPLQGEDSDFSEVVWETSWEPEEGLVGYERWGLLAREFDTRRNKPLPETWPRYDNHLSNIDRQGHWPALHTEPTHPLASNPALQQFIHIDPLSSINPDKDIAATASFEILRSVPGSELVDIYQPS